MNYQTFRTDVYTNAQDGYDTYRIPTMVCTPTGKILAFCEARSSHNDVGDIDIVVKESNDEGRTWSKQRLVYGVEGDTTIGNPCPVVEKQTGVIHVVFTRDYHHLYYTKSTDDGLSWEEPRSISSLIKDFNYDYTTIASGPVHGIELSRTVPGRLVIPIWICDRSREERYTDVTNDRIRAGLIYSDDKGLTWQAGGLAPTYVPLMHEGTIAELKNGSIMLNTRAWRSGYRAVTHSYDGGITWERPHRDKRLADRSIQASLYRTTEGTLLFSNPAVKSTSPYDADARKQLTLRSSNDDGVTWNSSIVVEEKFAGYSDLTQTLDGTILCLFENGTKIYREKISVVGISQAWLNQ